MIRIGQLTVIGMGLIGGSLARALREAGAVDEVVAVGRRREGVDRAVALGVADRGTTDPARGVADADMVVIGVPLGAVRGVFEAVADALPADCVVTDVGSAKGSVVEDARAVFGAVPPWFVPGHPVAGTERSGVEAGFPELFRGRRVILTPGPDTDPAALSRVRGMWTSAGAEVSEMAVAHHDRMLAATSHLPHLLAYGLVDTLSRWDASHEVFEYAAGGFRDFTRIASSDPVMWRDICLANREAVLETLLRYREDLDALTEWVRAGDGDSLEAVFSRAKATRDDFLHVFER
ncbi:Cyclohexadienyl dehydrogenase [wastewater metagenome]|uniref:Cyclohexadienyl dehydrogenase n=2 Tax=unclassified sequences TaxID=12908 RepID=A0A5B8RB89_9ZZZZ|nr:MULTISPECIES: prephenate dehydrogenase/arogenate dehydrogenase family protein [Arhodomonas]MCS4505038.1 prephenate dehydrogenase/arogenate dehydrogenase family protein [Arhodomonas aquaeolei]QEA06070.1 cyclohexadienyl dehydrogenase [uncultured organism]